jgi:tRNA dimethylallyltransferase
VKSPSAESPEQAVLCLAGPTACGKTDAALRLAQNWPLEIISVDSALVYRGMNIGTAKPSAAQRAQVPHHLIDILEPTQSYSAAQFVRDAQKLIGEIRGRGRFPLLVGGTMLYFKVLFEGLDAMPGADVKVRAELDAQAREHGWPALHAELARVDPMTAARLPTGDTQRIQRALEVFRITGRPLSALHQRTSRAADQCFPKHDFKLLSLEPQNRSWLHQRMAQRFAQMLDEGLLQEVQALRARGDLQADLPAMRCVGYRQIWQALDDGDQGKPLITLPENVAEQALAATRQLAKRQLTWLRSMPTRTVVACDQADVAEQVLQEARCVWG